MQLSSLETINSMFILYTNTSEKQLSAEFGLEYVSEPYTCTVPSDAQILIVTPRYGVVST